ALAVAQDRLSEKGFIAGLGGRPPAYRAVDDLAGLEAAIEALGLPAVLKTRRFGYDGKGQARLAQASDAESAWTTVRGSPSILEAFVPFEAEFSILLCRGRDGKTVVWPAPRNVHEGGVLRRSTVPAEGLEAQIAEGEALARRAADRLDYVGVLALEFFAAPQGPLFNEMAPRVHNSGHWTIEGAVTSQFENHVRAICGLPLGSTALAGLRVEMDNLIGGEADSWSEILSDPASHLHLYGKGEARPGRKMGHVTRLIR
ncbi:MAG TPA: ATP-grasp domain-containing protein, partial [Allosphingosinicella sp.]